MPISDSTVQRGIYQIRHINSGRIYIGSAVNIDKRWRGHRWSLDQRTHRNRPLQLAWNKYGSDAFEWTVLELVQDKKDLLRIEQEHIDKHQPFGRRGYNICFKASSSLGVKRRPATRAKLSVLHKGRKQSPEAIAKRAAANRGKKRSPEHCANMSTILKGKVFSPEHCANISAGKMGRPSTMKGKKHSLEARAKMSAAHKGKKLSPETIAKMSATTKGRTYSPEARANMSAAARNRRPKPPVNQLAFEFNE